MKIKLLLLITVLTLTSPLVNAAIVDISVETDKPVYQLGDDVVVSVIAINPTDEPIQLSFESTLQATYQTDDVFDWTEGKSFFQWVTYVDLPAFGLHRWDLTHGSEERELYPLDLGTHTVVGEVVGYGTSGSIQFEVIPEPATILSVVLGFMIIRVRKQ